MSGQRNTRARPCVGLCRHVLCNPRPAPKAAPPSPPTRMVLGQPVTDPPWTPTASALAAETVSILGDLIPLRMLWMAGMTDEERHAWMQGVLQPVVDCADVRVPGKAGRMRTEPLTGGSVLTFGGPTYWVEVRAYATAIAAMAFQPGGVTVFGRHWCAYHDRCEVV